MKDCIDCSFQNISSDEAQPKLQKIDQKFGNFLLMHIRSVQLIFKGKVRRRFRPNAQITCKFMEENALIRIVLLLDNAN